MSAAETIFAWIDQALQHGPPAAAFEQLADRFRREKDYRSLFDVRLMQARLELGLPLVSTSRIADVPQQHQDAYQQRYVQAAREVGEHLLADGNIPRAWPYFRATGDTAAIVQALDTFRAPDPDTPESRESLAATIHIAFQERVHPQRGFELILEHYGLCRAITMFSGYPDSGRTARLGAPPCSNASRATRRQSPARDRRGRRLRTESGSVPALIEGRAWLFANNAQHTDSSHIVPVLKFSAELDDAEHCVWRWKSPTTRGISLRCSITPTIRRSRTRTPITRYI